MYVYLSVHVHVYTCMHLLMRYDTAFPSLTRAGAALILSHSHVSMYDVCSCLHVHVSIYARVCACMFVCMQACMHVCTSMSYLSLCCSVYLHSNFLVEKLYDFFLQFLCILVHYSTSPHTRMLAYQSNYMHPYHTDNIR